MGGSLFDPNFRIALEEPDEMKNSGKFCGGDGGYSQISEEELTLLTETETSGTSHTSYYRSVSEKLIITLGKDGAIYHFNGKSCRCRQSLETCGYHRCRRCLCQRIISRSCSNAELASTYETVLVEVIRKANSLGK